MCGPGSLTTLEGMTAAGPTSRPDPDLIVNPASGERIRIRPAAGGQDHDVLVWDLWLAAGGRVPSGHVHPRQSETFHVRQGTLRFRIGLFRHVVLGPGQSLRVEAGVPHHFATVGGTEVHAVVETRPQLRMEALLRVAAGLATDDHGRARRLPRPLDLLLFMDEFRAEVQAPYLPAALVRRTVAGLARLIRRLGLDGHYRRVRSSSAPSSRAKASR
jgi:mannose-6-phosphate isomerase-like protein (cupin superfamily)